MTSPRKIILACGQCPGDIVMLTAAVRDLHAAHPGKFVTDVRTPCPALWEHNPHITPLREDEAERVEMKYELIHRSNTHPYHFIHGFRVWLEEKLGVAIPPGPFKGDIHLSDDERRWMSQVEESLGTGARYWIVVAGGKFDFTAKWWAPERYQEVVDHFAGRIQFVQVGEKGHHHPPLRGVLDLRGKTDLRQLVRLVHHADGVLCPVTSLMHLAAAVPVKPGRLKNRACVVIAGGREPSQWEAYPHHQYLHTNGALMCCDNGGCWKSRVTPLGDGKPQDKSLCVDPVEIAPGRHLPRCLDMISAADAIRAVEIYRPATVPATGLVIATFGSAPYVHLQLALARRFAPRMPILVHDDASGDPRLPLLCARYGAAFESTPRRLGHVPGDMTAFVAGLRWAAQIGLRNVVKFSRRWVPLVPWVGALEKLMAESGWATANARCLHHGFGFRSECVAMRVESWNRAAVIEHLTRHIEATSSLAPEVTAPHTGVLVEAVIHQCAALAAAPLSDRAAAWEKENPPLPGCGNYAVWPLMGESRVAPRHDVLWHEWTRAHEYRRALAALGHAEYDEADFINPSANLNR